MSLKASLVHPARRLIPGERSVTLRPDKHIASKTGEFRRTGSAVGQTTRLLNWLIVWTSSGDKITGVDNLTTLSVNVPFLSRIAISLDKVATNSLSQITVLLSNALGSSKYKHPPEVCGVD